MSSFRARKTQRTMGQVKSSGNDRPINSQMLLIHLRKMRDSRQEPFEAILSDLKASCVEVSSPGKLAGSREAFKNLQQKTRSTFAAGNICEVSLGVDWIDLSLFPALARN